MPSFTPPAATAVDFALATFTAPASTAVDFQLGALTPPVGPVVTSPLGPTDASGITPTGSLTSDEPLDGTPLQFIRIDAVSPSGTLRFAALPETP